MATGSITDIATPRTRTQTTRLRGIHLHTHAHMRKLTVVLATIATLALTRTASAQKGEPDLGELEPFFAYLALISTPTAGMPDAVPFWMTGAQRAGLGFRASFGFVDLEGGSIRNFAGTFDIPFGRNDLGLSVGYFSPDCDGECDGHVMFGADYSRPLITGQAGEGQSQFMLGVLANVGYAKPDIVDLGTEVDMTSWSFTLGTPLSMNIPSGRAKIIPFLTPSLGWGQISVSAESDGFEASVDLDDFRFVLSGGVGIAGLANGLTLNAGLKKVFVDEGDILFGVGMTWNGVR